MHKLKYFVLGDKILIAVMYMHFHWIGGHWSCLYFPTFQFVELVHQEDSGRRGKRDYYRTSLTNVDLVYRINENISNEPIVDSKNNESTVKPTHKQDSSIMAKNDFNCMPSVWQSYRNSEFSKNNYLYYNGIMENRY